MMRLFSFVRRLSPTQALRAFIVTDAAVRRLSDGLRGDL